MGPPVPTYKPVPPNVDTSQEVKLFTTTNERQKYENMADMYAIIVTTDYLEKAYIRDTISAGDYTPVRFVCACVLFWH